MDNSTYDVLNLPPIDTNDTYSTLETIPTKSYEAKRNEDINGYGMKNIEQKSSNETLNKKNKPLLVAIIIIMVILLLISIASLALSVATYNQLKPEQSTFQLQQSNDDNYITAAQMLLATTCSNISQILFQVDTKVNELTSLLLRNTDMEPQSNCGPGLWYRVAHLNMSDPSQQCPCVWNENEIRACGRPVSSVGGCATNRYLINNQYSRVCGRVIGYQVSSTDAFGQHGNEDVDFDGVNITSGAQRDHVWSYVSSLSESQSSNFRSNCPCSPANGHHPPSSIGDNYYCESGNPNNGWMHQIYSEDKLWDGQQCEGTCCNSTMTPPWFSIQLPAPTTDMIEVSICCDQGTHDEDTLIELLEIYIQ